MDPVHAIDLATEEAPSAVEEGVALALSGGGYRAMVFHVGVLWRLNELGVLRTLSRVSSVSGGSITAGVLALAWKELERANFGSGAFRMHVVEPVRRMARQTIDVRSILGGVLLPGIAVGDFITRAYRNTLFAHATLQDLPESPRFVFNATNVQSGVLVRFSKPYIWDYRVGKIEFPIVELARAVAASSAFPPVLSPVTMEVPRGAVKSGSGQDLEIEPYTTNWVLSDGGVYDNLGLETIAKRYRTLLVSDAGGKMQPDPKPNHDWAFHSKRVLDVIDNQVRSLRKRSLIDAYVASDDSHRRSGAYWGIRTDIRDYQLPSALPADFARSQELASIETRLQHMDEDIQERLINWGYAVCDAAVRKHWLLEASRPTGLPFEATGI